MPRHLGRAVAALREIEKAPDHLLTHLSPLGWEHVKLIGDYVRAVTDDVRETGDGLRPLRAVPGATRLAAWVRSSSRLG